MSQLPFGPDDLTSPPLGGQAFLDLLEEDYRRKWAAPPPFFERLFAGDLDGEAAQLWVKDQYLYWDKLYFSTGAIFVKTNEPTVRSHLLAKLVEVEGRVLVNDVQSSWTAPAYEELWLRVGEGLGAPRDEITDFSTYTRSFFCVSTLCMYSRGWEWNWLDGLANLYAADKYYVDYLERAGAALAGQFGLDDRATEFFRAVVGDARENLVFEAAGLAHWACTTERQLTAARAFRERLDIERQLLVALEEALGGTATPFQIPTGAEIPALLERR